MKHQYTINGMTCNGCKATVEKTLLTISEITEVSINLDDKTAELTMQKHVATQKLQSILPDKYKITEQNVYMSDDEKVANKPVLQQLFPLFLIFAYLLITSVAMNFKTLSLENLMLDFMGLFYIIFSLFKFLDLKGFAMSFAMYDPLAKKFNLYGSIYPFIELFLGILFLSRTQIDIALIATLVILGITTIGVTKTLVDKKAVQCACLGSVLNLPMTKATFIENSIMILMAIWMFVK